MGVKLDKLLQKCSPDYFQQIKAMAYYLVHQGEALSNYKTWCASHIPDIAASLSSQNINDILDILHLEAPTDFCSKISKCCNQ